MGSWLGRVAARYRMGVPQLVKDYDLQVPMNASGPGWLLLPALNVEVLQRLAKLARMKVDMLQAIQTPVSWSSDCRNVFYCRVCLFVNPEDVFSPMWKRQWFDLQNRHCTVHHKPLESLAASKIRQCSNFDDILKTISRKEQQLRLMQRLYPH